MYARVNKKFKNDPKNKKRKKLVRFDTKPIEGYQEHVNIVTGEKFPYCCEYHTILYESIKELSVEPHLQDLPYKLTHQIAFT